MTVRIASYNVHGLRDDVPALIRVITALRADVLCVQEAPRFWSWRARRAELAARAGLRVAASIRVGGVAVLTGPRAGVLHGESHALRAFRTLERRALAIAVVEAGGARLAVGSFHLDLDAGARLHHAAEAVALMERVADRFGAMVVLGGDINEQAHQPAWRFLAGRLADCHAEAPPPTFPAREPAMRIDAVFAAREARVVTCGTADAAIADLAGASDHRPVVVELRVGL
ncbi:endonuclease/exonuclease/phosphatase family protein [Nonomuraea sp. NPDC002799]